MIELNNVTKNYGDRPVLKGVSFKVDDGQIAGILGPNGAGKSTTMNILAGYLSPTEGEVYIQGLDMMDQPVEGRRQIGYLPETPPLYDDMTVDEYLDFIARAKGVKDKAVRKGILDEVMDKTGITGLNRRLIGNLSKGFRQRVGLAQALVGSPRVLVLDEPTAGLDPGQVLEMRNLIRDLAGEHTIILSSHFLSELQVICDQVIIMIDGKIALDARADQLAEKYEQKDLLRLIVRGNPAKLIKTLQEAGFVEEFSLIPDQEERVKAAGKAEDTAKKTGEAAGKEETGKKETEKAEAAAGKEEAATEKAEAAAGKEVVVTEKAEDTAKKTGDAAGEEETGKKETEKTEAAAGKEEAPAGKEETATGKAETGTIIEKHGPEAEKAEAKTGKAEVTVPDGTDGKARSAGKAEPGTETHEDQKGGSKKKKKKKKADHNRNSEEKQPSAQVKDIELTVKLKKDSKSRDQLFYLMARKKMPILHMESVKTSLEDVFVQLIKEYAGKEGEEGQE